ncbi:hypothetical protein XM53_07475 [Roseovarius atlanticus]|uniref:Uncharacterized protein n=1 Tax=Roseovarius atlanticus TaxID=1641875 RepID=A0A0T5NWJ8_9RHOB|nr:hypothetical protein [Roseovarius atlanticus]KRS12991.1 hypothetical protein XM53_07475 [Roseovarius atlanticus]
MTHATNTHQGFDARLKKIDRNRARLTNGYSAKVTRDGLIVFRPKRRAQGFSVRGLAFLVLGVFLFKAMILAHLGGTIYDQRVDALKSGTLVEQAGAFVMQKDQVSTFIAQYLRPFVK